MTESDEPETVRAGELVPRDDPGRPRLPARRLPAAPAGGSTGASPRSARGAPSLLAAPCATLVFVLALVGFGSKAGLVPLHVWLPLAHPAAPSHVSALMSGVMIKMGIYGLLRVGLDLLGGGPAVVGRARARGGRGLGAARRPLRADGARPQAPARLSLRREHRHHLDRASARASSSRATDSAALAALGFVGGLYHTRQPRLLQGAALPGRGLGAARHGHAQHGRDGRPDQADAVDGAPASSSAPPPSRRCRRSTASSREWLVFQALLRRRRQSPRRRWPC